MLNSRFDWRLTFINLKNGSDEVNTIGEKDSKIVWIPNLIFENSPSGVYIQNHALSSLSVTAKEEPLSKFDFNFQEFEEFSGISNPLCFKSSYELKLGCEFELLYYPFDYQECYITVKFALYNFCFNLLSEFHFLPCFSMITNIRDI